MLVCACLIGFVAATSASAGDSNRDDRNPLAGSYAGVNQEGHPVTFRITSKGKVVDFAGGITLVCYPTTPPPPFTFATGTLVTVTVTFPPTKLEKPTGNFPKGKRFTYQGPDAQYGGSLTVTGKPAGSTRKVEGFISVKQVDGSSVGLPGQQCRNRQNGELGGVGLANYEVKKKKKG